MDIDIIFEKYQIEDRCLIEYIQQKIDEKQKSRNWDVGVNGKSNNLVTMLMYEYASSIEKLTNRKIKAKQVIDKLSNQMGKFRIGDFKLGEDESITYDGKSVTSEEYKKQCRIDTKFGAHAIEYKDDEGKSKTAVVLFDDSQVESINGNQYTLSGINLQDLADIRHTVFHEWTHIMERCMIKTSQLSKEDIVYRNGESTYINAMLSPDFSKQKYEDYISGIDDLLASKEEVLFGGIYTIELNDKKSPNRRIMHNQISEGATEFIARKVMGTIGEKVKHPDRYAEQVRIMGDIFTRNGLSEMIAQYFTEPNKIIKTLESKRVQNKDMLHYISDYINSSNIVKIFNRVKIGKDGNVKLGIVSKLSDKVKRFFSKKDSIALPEGNLNYVSNERTKSKNAYLEGIKVSPEELIENSKIQEQTIKEEAKQDIINELDLDD